MIKSRKSRFSDGLGGQSNYKGCTFIFKGNRNKVIIGEKVSLKGVTLWIEGDGNLIIIGNETTIESPCQIAACEGKKVEIGNDCMFGPNLCIRTSDSHPLFDSTGQRINNAKDVSIGNHVWCGADVLILKGTIVPNDSVVGARSLLTTSCKKTNSVYAGSPCKLIKSNIEWKRSLEEC